MTDFDDPIAPYEPDDFDSEETTDGQGGRDTLWRVAIGLLVVASLVAAVLIGRLVVPVAVGGAVDGVSAAAGGVGDAAAEAGDTWSTWSGRLEEIASRAVQTEPEPVVVPAGSRSMLLTMADADDRGVAFALIASAPDESVTVALVVPGLLGVLPGYGDFPLREATVFSGPELAALTLTNLLGVRVDDVLHLGPGDLAAALPGPIEVDLPVPLIVAEGEEGRVLAKSGRAERLPAVVETVIATRGTADQLEWLQRQGAALTAVFEAIAAEPEIADVLAAFAGDPSEAETLLRAVAESTERNVTALPVMRVSVGGGTDGYTLAGDIVGSFVEQRFGHLLQVEGERTRVELLNGNGQVGATRLVAQELVRRGYRVIKTDNADSFDYATTQVVAQGRVNRIPAEAILALLGKGELLLEVRAPSGVVDISIIVGQDIPVGER